MKPIKDFEEYIAEGIVSKKTADHSRSKNCLNEAKNTEEFIQEIVQKIGINNKNANTLIKLIYDVIMEKIRSKMILEGYFAQGKGAHEAEVSYLKKLQFSQRDIEFTDQLNSLRKSRTFCA
jgi:hypothetical protein